MIKIFSFFLLVLGSFSSVLAAAEDSPQGLTRQYMTLLGYGDLTPEIKTPKEGIAFIGKCINQLGGKFHGDYVKSGPVYGFSFVQKNTAPVDFAAALLTAKKSWKKETILKTPITIADIGCGLGFSALCLVSKVVEVYNSEPGWKFLHPIELHLYDITPEHREALDSLAALINAAYPEYFHLQTFTHDAKEPFPCAQNTYNLMFALNLLHYVPKTDWPKVVSNIENSLKPKGILLVTTDHYACTGSDEQNESLAKAAEENEKLGLSPFVSPSIPLFNPLFKANHQTLAYNSSFAPFLKGPYVPGKLTETAEIDIDAIAKILWKNSIERFKPKGTVGLWNGEEIEETPIAEVIERLKDGRLSIRLSTYAFDEKLLARAIHSSDTKKTLNLLKAAWPKDLPKREGGYPSSVGLTFTKK